VNNEVRSLTQANPGPSERFTATLQPDFFSGAWPIAGAAAIALLAAAEYYASLRVAGNHGGLLWAELLRGSLLLLAAIVGSAVVFAIATRHGAKLRNQNLLRISDELLAKTTSARETDERFRLIFHGNPLPTYVYDCASLRLLDLNQAAADKYGYTLDEFLRLRVPDIRPCLATADLLQELEGRQAGFNHAGVWRQRRKDGSVFSAEAMVVRFVQDGRDRELVLATDVAHRVEAEEALRVSQERLRSLVDGAPFGICRSDVLAERFETVNPAFCAMLGYSERR
jgi:PAS domain S-box-containing protein